MFGLENKNKKQFEFDLEKEIKKQSKRKKELLEHFSSQEKKLKEVLRKGNAEENFDQCGLLLHAYAAATKVIKRIKN